MKRLIREINVGKYQGTNGQYESFQGMISGNVLGEFYQKLPMGRKDANFGRVITEETIGSVVSNI